MGLEYRRCSGNLFLFSLIKGETFCRVDVGGGYDGSGTVSGGDALSMFWQLFHSSCRGPRSKNATPYWPELVAARFLLATNKRGAGWHAAAKDRCGATPRPCRVFEVLPDGVEESRVARR